ncbi:MAG: thiol peroxidase [Planctomycetaceae bacterium]
MPQVTLKGNPVTLAGGEIKVGQPAPDFKLQNNALEEISLGSSAGKVRIIASVPSLDTPTCHTETKRFNEEAAKLSGVEVLVVSTDLPFGQKRWCGAEGVSNVSCLSDHRDVSFGKAYGVLISGGKLDRCLARAVFVIGKDGTVKHVEYCSEIANEPNYDAVLTAAKN